MRKNIKKMIEKWSPTIEAINPYLVFARNLTNTIYSLYLILDLIKSKY